MINGFIMIVDVYINYNRQSETRIVHTCTCATSDLSSGPKQHSIWERCLHWGMQISWRQKKPNATGGAISGLDFISIHI